jgi:hypothetical protein
MNPAPIIPTPIFLAMELLLFVFRAGPGSVALKDGLCWNVVKSPGPTL